MDKFVKFSERVLASQSEKDQLELQYQIEDAEDQLKSDIKATERALTKAKRELEKSYGALPFNTQNILNAEANVDSLTEGLAKSKALLKKLF